MNCPVCSGQSQVRGTKPDVESVHRKRECKRCGYVFYTEERLAKNSYGYKFIYNEYKRKKHDQYYQAQRKKLIRSKPNE